MTQDCVAPRHRIVPDLEGSQVDGLSRARAPARGQVGMAPLAPLLLPSAGRAVRAGIR